MRSNQSNRFLDRIILLLFGLVFFIFLIGLIVNIDNLQCIQINSSKYDIEVSKMTILSWKPRIFSYKHFLTIEECNHLINLAKNKLEESHVTTNEGNVVKSDFRVSSQAWIPINYDTIVNKIEEKISKWTMLPIDQGEKLQVLKYEIGGQFKPHYDYVPNIVSDQLDGTRVATVIMFLSNVTKGGEVAFPYGNSNTKFDDSWTECGKNGLGIKPNKGDALLFYNIDPVGKQDILSLHAGCPVLEGIKWSATKWLHTLPYVPNMDELEDYNKNCLIWAQTGECTRNEEIMVGDVYRNGLCQKSCKLLENTYTN
jgi:prolyl 4-hydroxylase